MSIFCSVVIPCKNLHKIISRAVESALKIGFVNEVIVVDDFSSPRISIKIFEDLPFYEKLRILPNFGNGGAQSARVSGAKIANNDILFFLDSDDILIEEGISVLFEHLRSNLDLAMVYGNVKMGNSQSDFLRVEGNAFDLILKNLCLCPFSGLGVRKSLVPWGELDLTLPSWQDDDFVLTVAKKNKIRFLDTIVASMVCSSDSISVSKYRQYRGLTILLRKWRKDILDVFGWPRFFLWRIRQLALAFLSLSQFLQKRANTRSIYCKLIRRMEILAWRIGEFLIRRVRRYFDRIYA